MSVFLFVAWLWLVSAVLSFGITFGYFQNSYPQFAWRNRRADAGLAALFALFGPVSLVSTILLSGFAKHGLRYRPLSHDESWAAHQKQYPSLDHDDFLRS